MKFNLTDGALEVPDSVEQGGKYLADLVRNRGRNVEDSVQIRWDDMRRILFSGKAENAKVLKDAGISYTELKPLLKTTIEVVVHESVEPMMTILPLFTSVVGEGVTQNMISIQAMGGAMQASEIPEGGSYPEFSVQFGGGMQKAWFGKSGIATSFTDEALRYCTWDILGIHLREMGKAMNRFQEQKAINMLYGLGTTLVDNANPSTSVLGVTTGRGIDGAANGTLTMDDLFAAMAHGDEELGSGGFDTMLINPLFFYQYVSDPVMRAMFLNGNASQYINQWRGTVGPQDPWTYGSWGSQGPSRGNQITPLGTVGATGTVGREHGMNSTPVLPSYFPFPLNIIPSWTVPFDAETKLGSILLLKSGEVGVYLRETERSMAEWRDENVDTVKIKLTDRTGFAIANEGQSVGVLKNIKLGKNYWDGVLHAQTMDIDTEIDPDTAVV